MPIVVAWEPPSDKPDKTEKSNTEANLSTRDYVHEHGRKSKRNIFFDITFSQSE